ncbi:D-alanyl-D-alanine carboxypeptidase [Heyndrickxia oleronia]|uniref:D-alanyl-D-alanine carboxypeptidase n=1 Tax=Heyndrickxia oleronia TaxID=38875 RepID=A0A8E2LHD5_9BACI|nr:D-alanyl-D-alanine carboxypeptidase family protein [Heyndrickxia oleronia]MEC1375121.1 D-alanyl-D-alanine carboxypeptidase [Heyndrickxia oleronia]OOP70134.1 D-alanyl-D-alanine carboxypeptidase [Heyndrickxia oleronia]QQZ05327.1 D-alanyl-D-alanine carboxypeptidase [Heyndrickxia oleronia]
MKKFILLCFVLFLTGILYKYSDGIKDRIKEISVSSSEQLINGEAGVLMDENSGEILYAKNANERLFPASTTKILTALIALNKGNINDTVHIGDEVTLREPDESSAGLKPGQSLSLKVLLRAMLLPSGNDAARSVAVYVAKKESNNPQMSSKEALDYFAQLMNQEANRLGAKHSHFVNPHGLHNPNHYSTAKDLALIAREARKNSEFREIVSEEMYKDAKHTYYNRNELVNRGSQNYYQGANGIKTGFTDQAGYCLVSSASRNGKNLIAVVLHSTNSDVWSDSTAMLEYGFEEKYASK